MNKQGGVYKFFCVFLLILGVFNPRFFYWPKTIIASEEPRVLINEIAWMGTKISANHEWIELFNNSGNIIDINDWMLVARDGSPKIILKGQVEVNGFFLLERTSDETVPDVSADQIYSGALGNEGEYLELFDNDGALIDYIDNGEGWLTGDNINKRTLVRSAEGQLSNSQNENGTPREANDYYVENLEETKEVIENPEDAGEEYEITDEEVMDNLIVINEVVSDPSDGENEWVELLNVSGRNISLNGWTIEEGSGAKTALIGELEAIGEKSFFIIEKPKGNLNNSGDIIILRDAQENIIDEVTYGNWDEGNIEDNAPAAADPYSLARINKEKNSLSDLQNFTITAETTKGAENIILNPDSEEGQDNSKTGSTKINIIISEIYPNPYGEESKSEFIELYNAGDEEVDLLEWQIGNEKEYRYRFLNSRIIKAGEFLVLYRSETKIILNNNEATINLYKIDRKSPIDKLKYEKAEQGKSLNCLDTEMNILGKMANLDCVWSSEQSPGKANKIVIPNRDPVPDFSIESELVARLPIIFDSSDTYDPDDDEITFAWDFGDGFESTNSRQDHTYAKAGEYEVVLSVSDGESEAEHKKKIKIIEQEFEINLIENPEIKTDWSKLSLHKLLPNPEGIDNDGEWIEIKNNGTRSVDLLDWQVDDGDGGSRPFKFKDSLLLSSNQIFSLSREDSGLALNNSGDMVRLIAPDNSLIEAIEYGKSAEGGIYARGADKRWSWVIENGQSSENGAKVSGAKKAGSTKVKISETISFKAIDLAEIGETNIGENLSVRGKVSVLPGIFGSQYFYIYDTAGLQIYSNKKDFPPLKMGDIVGVNGELSLASGELRLKTKSKKDIIVIGHENDLEFRPSSCSVLDEEVIGTPLMLTGEIVKKQSGVIYLDDGGGETKVYVKPSTGIILDKYAVGKNISVKGILTNSSSGKRIMPRNEGDISVLDGQIAKNENGRVLGATSSSSERLLEGNNKKKDYYVYIFMISLAGVTLIIFAFKKWKNKD